jgi:hypothetical protein
VFVSQQHYTTTPTNYHNSTSNEHHAGLKLSGGHWSLMPCLLAAMPSKYTEIYDQ